MFLDQRALWWIYKYEGPTKYKTTDLLETHARKSWQWGGTLGLGFWLVLYHLFCLPMCVCNKPYSYIFTLILKSVHQPHNNNPQGHHRLLLKQRKVWSSYPRLTGTLWPRCFFGCCFWEPPRTHTGPCPLKWGYWWSACDRTSPLLLLVSPHYASRTPAVCQKTCTTHTQPKQC